MISVADAAAHFDTTEPRARAQRRRSRVERWALSPISGYRVGLTGTYALTIYFGISGLVAGIPAFDLTAPSGFVTPWAIMVIIGALAAAVGSIHSESPVAASGLTRLQRVSRNVELIGTWLLFVTISSYAGVVLLLAYFIDPNGDRAAGGAGLIALGSVPFWRMVWLMAQLGRR